jgi:hypothetical protein
LKFTNKNILQKIKKEKSKKKEQKKQKKKKRKEQKKKKNVKIRLLQKEEKIIINYTIFKFKHEF